MMLSTFGAVKRFGDAHVKRMLRIPGLIRFYRLAYNITKPTGYVTLDTQVGQLRMNAADDVMFPQIAAYGAHEPEESALLAERLKQGMVVIDAGSNVGYHSLLASKAVGPSGRVFAFDPDPENMGLLRANLDLNGVTNVTTVNSALSDRAQTARFYRDTANHGAHTLSRTNVEVPGEEFSVSCVRLDDALEGLGVQRVDFIKVDIQGAEAMMLRGAKKTLERDRPTLLLEFWPAGLRAMGDRPLDLLEAMRGFGYRASVQLERLRRMDDLSEIVEVAVARRYVNLLFERI
jgi:FkbM family methyltransferase